MACSTDELAEPTEKGFCFGCGACSWACCVLCGGCGGTTAPCCGGAWVACCACCDGGEAGCGGGVGGFGAPARRASRSLRRVSFSGARVCALRSWSETMSDFGGF